MHDATALTTTSPEPSVDLAPAWTPETNRGLVTAWLRSKRSPHTRDAYTHDIAEFFLFLLNPNRPLRAALDQVTLEDIQDYAAALEQSSLSSASQQRKVATVKSLFTFAHKLGLLKVNVAAAQPLPAVEDTLAERILSTAQIQHMLYEAKQSSSPRNYLLLLTLYGSGCRCEEVCNLQWRNVQARDEAGQITVYGKGRKTRAIPLHAFVWNALLTAKPADAHPDDYVFPSRQTTIQDDGSASRRLDESQVWRIVKAIATKAGIPNASTHWLRHAHATHSMDAGAPLRLIMEILGHAHLSTAPTYKHILPPASTSHYLPL